MLANQGAKRYLIEGFLIIFSVLLALMLDKSFESYQLRKQRDSARAAIAQELDRNSKLVDALFEHHTAISERMSSLLDGKNDSLRTALLAYKYFNIWVLTNKKSIAPEFASSTAWETARSTGIIAEFDYAEVERLTGIYAQQDAVFKGTLISIVQFLFDRETHDIKNLDSTLLQLKLRFDELTAQERSLMYFYKKWKEENSKK